MKKRYYIIGFKNGKRIDLDCCNTLREASKLLVEYTFAYGKTLTIDIVLK